MVPLRGSSSGWERPLGLGRVEDDELHWPDRATGAQLLATRQRGMLGFPLMISLLTERGGFGPALRPCAIRLHSLSTPRWTRFVPTRWHGSASVVLDDGLNIAASLVTGPTLTLATHRMMLHGDALFSSAATLGYGSKFPADVRRWLMPSRCGTRCVQTGWAQSRFHGCHPATILAAR